MNFEPNKLNNNQHKNIYWLGYLGLIPNIGLIIGAVLLIKGFGRSDNNLKLIGIGNILFTPLFWFIFLNFMVNTSVLNKSNIKFTNKFLNEIVRDLENYKYENGIYPDSLAMLRKQNRLLNDNEIFHEFKFLIKPKPNKFYYKRTDSNYILKSWGPDKILNTKDDIYPRYRPKNR